jgi:hypothetical protein
MLRGCARMHGYLDRKEPLGSYDSCLGQARPCGMSFGRNYPRSTETIQYERSPLQAGTASNPTLMLTMAVFLTAEGGILFIYKDLDLRWRHLLWRIFAWASSTGMEGRYLIHHSPLHAFWINLMGLITIAAVNLLIVMKPVEIYRRLEVRPDCMIVEGEKVFWARFMENGWPTFQRDQEGNQVLCGIYGTRWVEYLTVHRFDELDRMVEVFSAHLKDAMMQLWTKLP